MVVKITTVAFEGIEAKFVDVQVQIASGLPSFTIVGLPDKAVGESRERVRAALHSIGLSLPAKRITINLAPADLPKEGSHYDLPIAIGLLAICGVLPNEELQEYIALGELSLDGTIDKVIGILPAAIAANSVGKGLICPSETGGEALWAGGELKVIAATNLITLINHFKGNQYIKEPTKLKIDKRSCFDLDISDIKGQQSAKRAMEVAAAGGHNILMVGPAGAGKSMLASRLPTILPPLTPSEMLETSMVASMAGLFSKGKISNKRPFRDPHHSASMPAMVGGGTKVKPGEISLAHNGVLFLDELPEFSLKVLDSLRQPIETGNVLIARANHHISYPANFQLVAAMNPCKCGKAFEPGYACIRGGNCAQKYISKLSGPLLDRFDIFVEMKAVKITDLSLPKSSVENSEIVAKRVEDARLKQKLRFDEIGLGELNNNSQIPDSKIDEIITINKDALSHIQKVANDNDLSARAYHRVLKLALTLSDLDGSDKISPFHISEALSYRINILNNISKKGDEEQKYSYDNIARFRRISS